MAPFCCSHSKPRHQIKIYNVVARRTPGGAGRTTRPSSRRAHAHETRRDALARQVLARRRAHARWPNARGPGARAGQAPTHNGPTPAHERADSLRPPRLNSVCPHRYTTAPLRLPRVRLRPPPPPRLGHLGSSSSIATARKSQLLT
jgi:hypothetical protein